MENLRDFINKKITTIDSSNLPTNLFLLKQTSSKNPEKFFDIKRVQLRDNADEHFKTLLAENLSKLSEFLNDNQIGDFFNDANNGQSIISVSQIYRLSGFVKESEKFDSIPKIHNDKAIKEINVHAYKIELNDDSKIIFFTKIPLGGKIKSKVGLLSNGHFTLMEEIPLIYEDRIDCIFFSDYDYLVVLEKQRMELIFKFDEYYKQKTKDVYDNKLQNKLLMAPDGLLNSIIDSSQITKKITRMEKENKFDITPEKLQKHMESLEENKDRFNDQFKNYRSLQLESGLYLTDNKDEFKVFLNACDKSVEIPLEQKEEKEPDIYLNPSPIKMTN